MTKYSVVMVVLFLFACAVPVKESRCSINHVTFQPCDAPNESVANNKSLSNPLPLSVAFGQRENKAPDYVIGAEDVLEISVWKSESSQLYRTRFGMSRLTRSRRRR